MQGRGRAWHSAQAGDEPLLGVQDLFDIAVAETAHSGQTLYHFLGDLWQVAAHEQ